jgi:caspase domain-containing protein
MARKALAVGINGYGSPNDLTTSTRDAETFASVLESVYRFESVRVVRDGEATRDGVDRALDWLTHGAGANDRLVFYFSGHGHRAERNGVVADALVLADGRMLDDHDFIERVDGLPAGVLTVVLDCSFAGGLEELLLGPNGEVEPVRVKRWMLPDAERLRQHRETLQRARGFSPFGYGKAVPSDALAACFRTPGAEPTPARLASLADPRAKLLVVAPCLEDEVAIASTTQTGGLSAFTFCLASSIRRLGPNRSAIEVLQTAGHELRRLGVRQTPLVKEPLEPQHLGLRAFLTFQPALFVSAPTPGGDAEEMHRSIAEAVRNTLEAMKEGRPMHMTMMPGQTTFGDDLGTIVNTVTPIVASVLQARQQQPYGGQPWPYGGYSGWSQGPQGLQQMSLPFAQIPPYEVAQITSTVTPIVLALLQGRGLQQPFGGQQPFGVQQPFGGQQAFGGFGYPSGGFGGGAWGSGHGSLQPHEISHLVSVITPIVASIVQSRGLQMPMGQGLPRAA